LLLNPAGMARQERLSIEAFYGFRAQDLGSTFNVSIVDPITRRLSAGIYYTYVQSSPRLSLVPLGPVTAARSGYETGVAAALAFGPRVSIGVAARYISVSTAVSNQSPSSQQDLNGTNPMILDTAANGAAGGFSVDAGLSLRLGAVDVGIAGYNLVPVGSFESPIAAAAAVAWRPRPNLTLALDGVLDIDKYRDPLSGAVRPSARVGAGVEWLVRGRLPLRAGASYDSGRPGTYLSVGAGYVHRWFSVAVAWRQQVEGGVESSVVGGVRVSLSSW
jgi:hypothetical protein